VNGANISNFRRIFVIDRLCAFVFDMHTLSYLPLSDLVPCLLLTVNHWPTAPLQHESGSALTTDSVPYIQLYTVSGLHAMPLLLRDSNWAPDAASMWSTRLYTTSGAPAPQLVRRTNIQIVGGAMHTALSSSMTQQRLRLPTTSRAIPMNSWISSLGKRLAAERTSRRPSVPVNPSCYNTGAHKGPSHGIEFLPLRFLF
jgi:hypothetical protein